MFLSTAPDVRAVAGMRAADVRGHERRRRAAARGGVTPRRAQGPARGRRGRRWIGPAAHAFTRRLPRSVLPFDDQIAVAAADADDATGERGVHDVPVAVAR